VHRQITTAVHAVRANNQEDHVMKRDLHGRYAVLNAQGTIAMRCYTLAEALSVASASGRVVHDSQTGKTQCRDCGRFTCNC
jgi:hypothetical protein